MKVLKKFERDGKRYAPGEDAPSGLDAETIAHYKRHGMVGSPAADPATVAATAKHQRSSRGPRSQGPSNGQPSGPSTTQAAGPTDAQGAKPGDGSLPAPSETKTELAGGSGPAPAGSTSPNEPPAPNDPPAP